MKKIIGNQCQSTIKLPTDVGSKTFNDFERLLLLLTDEKIDFDCRERERANGGYVRSGCAVADKLIFVGAKTFGLSNVENGDERRRYNMPVCRRAGYTGASVENESGSKSMPMHLLASSRKTARCRSNSGRSSEQRMASSSFSVFIFLFLSNSNTTGRCRPNFFSFRQLGVVV